MIHAFAVAWFSFACSSYGNSHDTGSDACTTGCLSGDALLQTSAQDASDASEFDSARPEPNSIYAPTPSPARLDEITSQKDFRLENNYDFLYINGQGFTQGFPETLPYSIGSRRITPTEHMLFVSDGSITQRGFRVCSNKLYGVKTINEVDPERNYRTGKNRDCYLDDQGFGGWKTCMSTPRNYYDKNYYNSMKCIGLVRGAEPLGRIRIKQWNFPGVENRDDHGTVTGYRCNMFGLQIYYGGVYTSYCTDMGRDLLEGMIPPTKITFWTESQDAPTFEICSMVFKGVTGKGCSYNKFTRCVTRVISYSHWEGCEFLVDEELVKIGKDMEKEYATWS